MFMFASISITIALFSSPFPFSETVHFPIHHLMHYTMSPPIRLYKCFFPGADSLRSSFASYTIIGNIFSCFLSRSAANDQRFSLSSEMKAFFCSSFFKLHHRVGIGFFSRPICRSSHTFSNILFRCHGFSVQTV